MNDTTERHDRPAKNDSEPSPTRAGEQIGPYVLLRSLGKGGLGEVWLAQRVSGDYTPEVAIKLLLGSRIGDSEIFRRFDRERRILARLDHPDIARLLDAGRFGQGWPYLVMEYVDGRRLDEAAKELDVPDRLRLFMRICQAVQFAHRRLVLHRDLKPSNILVTKDFQPRLLDFNTAKLLEADEDPDLTRLAAPMTRRYASPEQVREEPLTTASDIYSLGVVLYELLVQDSPYGPDTTSAHALNQAICEQEAEPPSRRGIGDRSLDAIVASAMHKDPDRRYPSAAALADDLGAWLDRRPIKARPMSRLERLGLTLRRNPVASGLIAGLTALVFCAMALFFWQMQEAREERDVAIAVTEFLESLFDATDPGSTSFTGEDLFAVLD
ncbi:MAG: serine/threonine-protein kinase, partial [Wenzhouxiangella sp.]|nr:serine/threonine-protein kinase [Wenzhouxiangella sp.]